MNKPIYMIWEEWMLVDSEGNKVVSIDDGLVGDIEHIVDCVNDYETLKRETEKLKQEIERLKEYEYMYNNLCK